MTEAELRSWLSRAKALDEKMLVYEEAVREARARAKRTTSNYAPRVSGSSDPHAKMDALAAACELIVRLFDRQLAAKIEIFRLIYSAPLDGRQRAFLVSYYLNGFTLEQSAVAVGVSYKQGIRIQKQALAIMLDSIN